MGGAHDLVRAEGSLIKQVQHIVPALVTELPGHGVHFLVLAEGPHAGGQNHQLAAVGHDHTGTIDALVAHPGGLELLGIQVGDHLLGPALHMNNVELLCQLAGLFKGHAAVADVETVEGRHIVFPGGDRLEEHHRQLAVNEVLLGIIIQHPGGAVPHAQSLLHTADRGEHVALVDHGTAAQTHKQVLGVVGHAHHLVGHHLAHGQNQVEAAVHQQVVDFHLDIRHVQSLADLGHHLLGHLAQHSGIALPVVHQDILIGHHIAEELLLFLRADRHVGSQGRHDLHFSAHGLEPRIEDLRNLTGKAVAAGIVGGNNQDLLQARILCQQLVAHGGDFIQRDAGPVGIIQLFHVCYSYSRLMVWRARPQKLRTHGAAAQAFAGISRQPSRLP